jgi:evolutionarily conserved signaling intermediate in Toll pathway
MMHNPRHQSCALKLLEKLENNYVLPDEDLCRLAIKIFGDWTHVVRKIKRQLYWGPKFKHINPYPVPTYQELETMNDIEIAYRALYRMCFSADKTSEINISYSDDDENTWFVTSQSPKQRELLSEHDPKVPIFIEGPFIAYVRNRKVEYFLMKSDELEKTMNKIKSLKEYNTNDISKMVNIYSDPFQDDFADKKKVEPSVHELEEGNIYAIFCSGTGTLNSIYNWTRQLEIKNECMRKLKIVYRVIDKPKSIQTDNDTETTKN